MSARACVDCGKTHDTAREADACDAAHGFVPGTRRKLTGAERYFIDRLRDDAYLAAYCGARAEGRR